MRGRLLFFPRSVFSPSVEKTNKKNSIKAFRTAECKYYNDILLTKKI